MTWRVDKVVCSPAAVPRLQFFEPGTLDHFDLGAWVDQLYTGRSQSSSWLVKVISNCALNPHCLYPISEEPGVLVSRLLGICETQAPAQTRVQPRPAR